VFTSAVGYGIALALGMDHVTALYVAVALTFSSTIIIVKLLSDKRELDQLHGRIAVGFLIVQDIVVVLVMIALTAFGQGAGDEPGRRDRGGGGVEGAGLLAGIALVMRFVFPRLLPVMARSQELLVLFAVAWAVSLAALTSDLLGFSTEVGAFLAGVSSPPPRTGRRSAPAWSASATSCCCSSSSELGARLEFVDAGRQLFDAAVLSAFVLIGNPLIVMVIMGPCAIRPHLVPGRPHRRPDQRVLPDPGRARDSASATSGGHGEPHHRGRAHHHRHLHLHDPLLAPIYDRLAPWLSRFERAHTVPEPEGPDEGVDVVLYGLGRYGGALARRFIAGGHRLLAVDFDPRAVMLWNRDGCTAVFGDAEDLELLASLPLERAPWVMSTVASVDTSLALMQGLREQEYRGRVAVTAHTAADARRLEAAGADAVLRPFSDAADAAVALLGEGRRRTAGVQEPA
jgi:hypothetical protein